MKRSRAFILSEQLMTIMLQAGFILVLCASFYQVISFYTRTQQVLTARNHAERVISFMDDKIRNAGLGLWRCNDSTAIRATLGNISMLVTKIKSNGTPDKGYKLPVSLKWYKDGMYQDERDIPSLSLPQNIGDVVTLLYACRDLSSGIEETISAFRAASTFDSYNSATKYVRLGLKLLDSSVNNAKNLATKSLFASGTNTNIKSYAVMEGFGYPMNLFSIVYQGKDAGNVTVDVYDVQSEAEARAMTVPAAGELLALRCMQMFVHGTDGTGEGRQFAFRELVDGGTGWYNTYNQEKGILDIYMELDTEKNTFTLWVLATGGYDASMNNPRPDTWPEQAQPTAAQWGKKINNNQDYTYYPHHIVYVSRATWKLNNIP